ncbi:MAG TPA: DNA polymerase Y family protein [Terracidiphilus sp.]|jgi:protein ImuB
MTHAKANSSLYACAHAAEFPAQALLRLRPDLRAKPVVVLEGRAPEEAVCALNQQARLRGAAPGMTRLEAESLPEVMLLSRSIEGEAAARAVFLECAAQFSPRIEDASRGTASIFVLDIQGTERLFGPPAQLAARLRASLAAAGFRASIAVSANYDAARVKAATTRGITVIPEGAEAGALEKLPLAALELAEEHEAIFALWGMRTLEELARLPEAELVTRLGAEARVWRQLARGEAAHAFQPIEPALALTEFCEFETPVEQIDSLLFIGARMIDCLVARAASRAFSLASIVAGMKLESGRIHRCILRPALPSADRKFLLKLLQLEIGSNPPAAAVVALTLAAEAGHAAKVQLGLFAPQLPEPSRLDVTLARLKALVGTDRVGSPALEDTHRRESFRMENFAMEGSLAGHAPKNGARMGHPKSGGEIAPARMALRRVRPPVPVGMVQRAMKPAAFRNSEESFEISAAYGPWLSSGCWWSGEGWNEEEWDVLATKNDGAEVACLLVCDRTRNAWRLEAYYD